MNAKRTFDFCCSSLGLLLLAPVFLVIAIWICLDSRGPIIFRQERVGLGGRPFRIHKFRTMHAGSERIGPQVTTATDTRITRAGAFLRKYKLDELPQLIDVLLGRMSMVGPRPEVPTYIALYPEQVRAVVLSIRPGVTDWASIQFRDESEILARSTDPERVYVEQVLPVKQDLYVKYVRERSFLGDVRTIVASIVSMLRTSR